MYCCDSYNKLPESIRIKLSGANMFYTSDYDRNVILRNQKVLYVWDETGILFCRIRERLFFKVAILDTEPFSFSEEYNGKMFVNEAMQALKDSGVKWTFTNTTARFQQYPFHGAVVPSGDYIIDLTLSEEDLWSNVHSKHRNSIRRGEKDGLELLIGGTELLNEYVPLSNETYNRSNIQDGGYDYYKGLIDALDNCSIIMLAKNQEGCQAGGLFYYNREMAYYVHGASIRRPSPGATNYLLWRSILFFKEKGVKKFSFVGYHFNPDPDSKLEGIQRFKERFGGPLEPCYNFRFVQNSFVYNIYKVYMQLKNHHKLTGYQDSIDKQIAQHHYTELNK